ncbi:MAG: hypothetical protein HYW07_20335 [Candidatus Latescibacteria bacterium]|nr:hypothetical protein [Candidatus Latescibacterota bacterium]
MDDEILKELRALREHLVAQHGGTLRALGEYVMQEQQKHPDRLVQRPSVSIDWKKLDGMATGG